MRPVLALWSRCGNLEEWYAGLRHLAELVQQGTWAALECGHYLPEEHPRETYSEPRTFFKVGAPVRQSASL